MSLLFLVSCWMEQNNELNNNSADNMEINTWTILALWDSLTAWYWVDREENYPSQLQEKLEQNGYNYEVINAWVSWDTSTWLRDRVNLYLEQEPDIVILVIWWNDWLRWMSLADLRENINYIIDVFDDDVQIVLWWMQIPANLWNRYVEDFSNLYPEIAEENPDVFFHSWFLEDVAWVAGLNLPDRIHPNREWYEIIVDNLYEFLENNNLLK